MQVPASVSHERAVSLEHALDLLSRLGDRAGLIAAGNYLPPMTPPLPATIDHLIDLSDLRAELGQVGAGPDEIRIGALARPGDVLESVLLHDLLPIFADAHRAVGGAIQGDQDTLADRLYRTGTPDALRTICVALGARCVIRTAGGTRTIPVERFRSGPDRTGIGSAELLTEVRISRRPGMSSAYVQAGPDGGTHAGPGDESCDVAAVGAMIRIRAGEIEDVRVALEVPEPYRTDVPGLDALMHGREPTADLLADAANLVADSIFPLSEGQSNETARDRVDDLTRQALRSAVARIG